MVRSAVLAITLTIFSCTYIYYMIVENASLKVFLISMPSVLYFGKLACYLREQWFLLDKKLKEHCSLTESSNKLQLIADDTFNFLLYMNDIMSHAPFLALILANSILYYAVCPVLISTLSSTRPIIERRIAIFALNQIFCTMTYRPLLEAIVQIIFLPFLSKEIIKVIEEFPMNYLQYSSTFISPSEIKFSNLPECNINT